MAKAKKPVVPEPTSTQVTIVFMGTVDTVNEAEIEKKVHAIERAVQKHVPGMAMDVAHSPIVEWPKLNAAQKEAVREHLLKELKSEEAAIVGSAAKAQKAVAAAAAGFFS